MLAEVVLMIPAKSLYRAAPASDRGMCRGASLVYGLQLECHYSWKNNDYSGRPALSQVCASMSYSERRITAAATDQRLHQLDLLFIYSRLSQWLVLLAAVVVAVLTWEHTSHTLVLSWLAVIFGLTLLRVRIARAYQRSSVEQRLRPYWAALFYTGNFFSGLALGLIHVLLVPVDSFAVQASTYAVTAGVMICVSIIQAHRFSAFLTFALRSEEHTSELQSRPHLVCRLLLEKKNHYPIFNVHVNNVLSTTDGAFIISAVPDSGTCTAVVSGVTQTLCSVASMTTNQVLTIELC